MTKPRRFTADEIAGMSMEQYATARDALLAQVNTPPPASSPTPTPTKAPAEPFDWQALYALADKWKNEHDGELPEYLWMPESTNPGILELAEDLFPVTVVTTKVRQPLFTDNQPLAPKPEPSDDQGSPVRAPRPWTDIEAEPLVDTVDWAKRMAGAVQKARKTNKPAAWGQSFLEAMTGQSATAEDIARIESILGGTTGRERRVWAVARSLNMIRDTFGPAVNTTVYPTMTPHNIRGRKWNNGDRIVYLGVDWDLRLLAHLAHAGVPERYLPRHLAGREYLCECSECKPTPLQFAMRAMDEDDWLRRDVNQGRIIYHFTSPYTPNVRTVPPNAYNWSVES